MKQIFLAAAALATFGIGSAMADGDVRVPQIQTQPQTASPQTTAHGTVDSHGIFVSNSPRHEVWVYGAMRGPGYPQGGTDN
ncbi:MAG: hypothetical protein BGO51_26620 [Rhodospirillales bacterium 69-11]|nr:hypothetical protein [Rhodospirillales bacterium]OJW19769.1 MAG: hypothetical protein BGO51_26620 [Rhodospirillales bacterium 69-11]